MLIDRIRESLIEGNHEEVERLAAQALSEGTPPGDLLQRGLIAGMDAVGERFRTREIFLPDVLLAARAMHAGLGILKPYLEGSAAVSRGVIVIGTVEGDLHDIGKNLVGILLRGAGYNVADLGHDVSPARFVAAAKELDARVVGMSTLLTTTMPAMGRVTSALREAGLAHVKTIIGGAPVSEAFAREIGADGYGYDAARACEIVKSWLP